MLGISARRGIEWARSFHDVCAEHDPCAVTVRRSTQAYTYTQGRARSENIKRKIFFYIENNVEYSYEL
mgnify:CR=1 FL=1